ncbi:cytochrome b5 [Linepithema humile]|uniref:cytochrome b5 n=1 Tax=Linepithema humile TaxID=83485 RepID=UPI00351F2412
MTDVYTADEVAHHDHEGDLWIVIHGKIYNLTSFLKEHPGGEEVLLALAGEDGTDCFDSIGHSQEALLLREKFYIGELVGGPRSQPSRKQETNAERPATTANDDWQRKAPKKGTSSWLPYALVFAIIFYYFWF